MYLVKHVNNSLLSIQVLLQVSCHSSLLHHCHFSILYVVPSPSSLSLSTFVFPSSPSHTVAVGLTQPEYTGSEDIGSVDICVNIVAGTVIDSVEITVITSDITAIGRVKYVHGTHHNGLCYTSGVRLGKAYIYIKERRIPTITCTILTREMCTYSTAGYLHAGLISVHKY